MSEGKFVKALPYTHPSKQQPPMSSEGERDIVERLRVNAKANAESVAIFYLENEAANEIERLRDIIRRGRLGEAEANATGPSLPRYGEGDREVERAV